MLDPPPGALTLTSDLADLTRVGPWLDELTSLYGIVPGARFAIELCLEEALSNVIRHGYGEEPGHRLTVSCAVAEPSQLVFTIQDEAPGFNPLEQPVLPALGPGDAFRLGGQGIRMLHKFAHTLDYEAGAPGNRLVLGFLNRPRIA